MGKYGLFVLMLIISISNAYAATITCTARGASERTLELPQSTLNSNVTDLVTVPGAYTAGAFQKLYTYKKVLVAGATSTECSGGNINTFSYVVPETARRTPWEHENYTIFPTSISGIGISFNDSSYSNAPMKDAANSIVNRAKNHHGSVLNWYMHMEVIIWRTPETLDSPDSSGLLRFGPFYIMHAFQPVLATDTFSSDSDNVGPMVTDRLPRSITLNSLAINGGLTLTTGTCNMETKTKIVQMGKHNASSLANGSPWVDASFKLTCPKAWGYGASSTLTGDQWHNSNGPKNTVIAHSVPTTMNKTVNVQIVPYIPSTAANSALGIFDLDPGGATGYGIQLAWGAPSTQNSSSTRYVPLNNRVAINEIDSNYAGGPYAYGTNALPVGTEGIIPMSARYVRTSGAMQGGLANGRVEILASYN